MRGFTLIEVLLALAISAIILTMVYGTFAQTSSVTTKVEEEGNVFHQARLIFSKMSEELTSAYWKEGSPSVNFIGTVSSLTFTSLSRPWSGLQYYLEPVPEDSLYLLMHLEETNIYSISNSSQELYALGEGISEFSLRYFNGNDWVDQWDANSMKRLPPAVEIKVQFKDARGDERDFSTIVEVPLGRNE